MPTQIQKQIEEALQRFDEELLNPERFNSQYQFKEDIIGRLPEVFKNFLVKELTTIATKSAEESLKNWYFEGDELVITKGKWVIDRYKKNN